MDNNRIDLLWANISSLPYFRGFLRAVEGRFFQDIGMLQPILDLGIGDGHFSSVSFSTMIDVGIDPSFRELLKAKQQKGCTSHVCGFGGNLPFKSDYFTTIFSNSVLEHIELLEPVLNEMNRILSVNGRCIITVPNDHFTENLSVGRFFQSIGMKNLASLYQQFFNKISRHHHPDSTAKWKQRFLQAGFKIVESWNYFPKKSLKILEWGHLFGIPSWISKKLFGKWVLFPAKWNLWIINAYLEKQYIKDQKTPDGAYSFFILEK